MDPNRTDTTTNTPTNSEEAPLRILDIVRDVASQETPPAAPTQQAVSASPAPESAPRNDTGTTPRVSTMSDAMHAQIDHPHAAPTAPTPAPEPAAQPKVPATPAPAPSVPSLADLGGTLPGKKTARETQPLESITEHDPSKEPLPLHPDANDIPDTQTERKPAAPEQPQAEAVPDTQPKHEMEVFAPGTNNKPKLPGDSVVPDAQGVLSPPQKPETLPQFSHDVNMKSIPLGEEMPHDPKQFSTSLAPEQPTGADAQKPSIPQQPKKSGFVIPSVHTLNDDMQRVMRTQSLSVVKASALEEKKKHAREKAQQELSSTDFSQPQAKKHRTTTILFILIAVFLILGAAVGGGFFWYHSLQTAPLPTGVSTQSIIFAEQAKGLSISNTSPTILKTALSQLRNDQSLPAGSITRIVATYTASTTIGSTAIPQAATPEQFFSAIGASPPLQLINALGSKIFIGVHAIDGNQPVIIIPVTSYENAFAGMLAWEPSMAKELTPFFPNAPVSVASPDGSTTGSSFSDIVIKNYDVRMLADSSGNPAILYSFPTQNWLVITSSPYTFIEVLGRLQAAHQL